MGFGCRRCFQSRYQINCLIKWRSSKHRDKSIIPGFANQTYAKDHTKGFQIFLHEKGQFWPGLEMERIGQTKSIYIPTKTEVWGTFTATQKINLATQSAPCVMDPSYSYTQCIFKYVDNLTPLVRTNVCDLSLWNQCMD